MRGLERRPRAISAVSYAFGAAEIAIALCLFLGLFRTAAYGAALARFTR